MCSNCCNQCDSGSDRDFQCCSKRKAVDFDCNIFLPERNCADKKREKRQQLREACRQHRQRIKELSKPRRSFYEIEPEKCPGKPLPALIPRLSQLSRPRWCTPKYVRPKSEEFCLPGVIQNWDANRVWTSQRAQPKKDFANLLKELQDKRTRKTAITCEGMQRIERLAKPRSRYMRCKPSSRNYHSRSLGYATERILQLSEPKPRVEQNNDFRPLSNVLEVSKTAMAYEATERIRYLAIPRTKNLEIKKEINDNLICKTFSCHENLRLNSRSSFERDLQSAQPENSKLSK